MAYQIWFVVLPAEPALRGVPRYEENLCVVRVPTIVQGGLFSLEHFSTSVSFWFLVHFQRAARAVGRWGANFRRAARAYGWADF